MRDDTKNCCVADYTTISQTQQQRAQRPVNRSRDHRSQDLPGALECTEQVCSRTAPHANFEPTNLPPHKQRKNTSLSPSRREKTPEKTTCFPTFFCLVFLFLVSFWLSPHRHIEQYKTCCLIFQMKHKHNAIQA